MSPKEGDSSSSQEDQGLTFDLGLKRKAGAGHTETSSGLVRQREPTERLEKRGLRMETTVGRVWGGPATLKKIPSNLFNMQILGPLPSNCESTVGRGICIFIEDFRVTLKFLTPLHSHPHCEKHW